MCLIVSGDLDADPPLLDLLHDLATGATRASSATSTSSSSRCCCWSWPGTSILLIVGWAFVGFASYALISFWYRRETATEAGMKAFVINVVGDVGLVLAALFIFRELGTFDLLGIFEAAPEELHDERGRRRRDRAAAAGRRLRQVGAGPAPHLASRRDGGPDPGLGPDPRGDDGHRRRLPDRPLPPDLRDRA